MAIGRPKGSKNKRAVAVTVNVLAAELKVDPLEILLRFAAGDWKGLGLKEVECVGTDRNGEPIFKQTIEPKMRMYAASEAAQYLYPKLKAVEHTTPPDANPQKVIVYTAEWGNKAEGTDPDSIE